MSIGEQSVLSSLKLTRYARLWGRICLSRFTLEVMFLVGTKSDTDEPVFHLETVKLVMKQKKEMGGTLFVAHQAKAVDIIVQQLQKKIKDVEPNIIS